MHLAEKHSLLGSETLRLDLQQLGVEALAKHIYSSTQSPSWLSADRDTIKTSRTQNDALKNS